MGDCKPYETTVSTQNKKYNVKVNDAVCADEKERAAAGFYTEARFKAYIAYLQETYGKDLLDLEQALQTAVGDKGWSFTAPDKPGGPNDLRVAILNFAQMQDSLYYKTYQKLANELNRTHTDDLLEMYIGLKYLKNNEYASNDNLSIMHDAWALARMFDFDFERCTFGPCKEALDNATEAETFVQLMDAAKTGGEVAKKTVITQDIIVSDHVLKARIQARHLFNFVHFKDLIYEVAITDTPPLMTFLTKIKLRAEGEDKALKYVLGIAAQAGGAKHKSYKRTDKRVSVGGRKAVVYEGPRGGSYVRIAGKYVSIKKLAKA